MMFRLLPVTRVVFFSQDQLFDNSVISCKAPSAKKGKKAKNKKNKKQKQIINV